MNDIHKKLIQMIVEEKLDTKNIFPIKANASKDIIAALTHNTRGEKQTSTIQQIKQQTNARELFQINEQKFTYYLQQRIPPTQQRYNPELSIMLDDLEEYQENHEYEALYHTAKNIFKKHKEILSFENASKIFLILADYNLRHGKHESAFVFLSSIKTYEKYLSPEHKKFFVYLLAQCLYHEGLKTNNSHYLNQAIEYSYQLTNNIHDKEIIKTALVIQINSFYVIGEFELCLWTIEEFFRIFPLTKDDMMSIQTLFLQGITYEAMGDNIKAIQTFRKYLQINPDDEDAKRIIRILSEKEGE